MTSDTLHPQAEIPSALPAGTRLGEFELLSVLGVGGFGIVYLAFDHALEREVAVKEYMPASLAGRTETLHVSLRSQSDAETFALGLKSFVNEARMLARFDHPSLLKVHRFWEANGTAYMAMPVMRGRTLKELRQGMAEPPGEAWVRGLLEPLLGAIERLHSEGVYHRDIAPDNIQLDAQGRPVLLDFGAARRVLSDMTHTLTAILKPAYAPIEQYAEVGSVRQGPWTDLYSLGATLHFLLLGHPPPPATARTIQDEPSALKVEHLRGCSEGFLRLVDWMLAPRPGDRPQSVGQLRDALAALGPAPPAAVPAEPSAASDPWARTQVLTGAAEARTGRPKADIPLDMAGQPTVWMSREGSEQRSVREGAASTAQRTDESSATAAAGHVGTTPAVAQSSAPVIEPVTATASTVRSEHPIPAARSPDEAPATAVAAPVEPAQQPIPSAAANGRRPWFWLGGGAAALLLAAVALWPRAPEVVALPAAAEPGSVAPLVGPAAPADGAAPAAADATGPAAGSGPQRAESAITTVVVPSGSQTQPGGAAAGAGAPVSALATPGPRVDATTPPALRATSALPRQQPQPSAATPQAQPALSDAKPSTAPARAAERAVDAGAPSSAVPAAPPQPAAATAAASPALPSGASVPAAGQTDGATGPQASCAGRNVFSHFVCMESACLKSANQAHPDCLAWRKDAKRD